MNESIIAWRNLWRNKRRTLITVASIFFGVILSTLMSSMQEGSYSSIVNNIVKFYSGYIQIHDKDFWEDRTLYYTFSQNDSVRKKIENVEGVSFLSERLESFALISSGENTQAVMVTGVDPKGEDKVSLLSQRISAGEYLQSGDRDILLGEELAKRLDSWTGDTVVLLGQGYFGSNEAAKFRIKGILKFPNPEMNRQFCYLDLSMAQEFYSASGMISSYVIMVPDYPEVKAVMKDLENVLGSDFKPMSWDEMQPELLQMIRGDRAGGIVMMIILYLIIGFGILGTVIMMIAERKKELAIMVAVGMQKTRLGKILFFETLYIGLIGVLAGMVINIPLIAIMIQHPIPLTGDLEKIMVDMGFEAKMYFSGAPFVFLNQVLIVFSICCFVSVYPLFSAFRLNVIRWMRQ